jgi:ferritin-like metal-binding protein YciE
MAANEELISWLNDAYAMERSIAEVLENHTKDASGHPEMKARLQQHLEETRSQMTMVHNCIERLGGTVSTTKALLGNFFGTLQGVSTGMFRDELVKNTILDHATEHFEIASYRALIAAAEKAKEPEVAQVCQKILAEEEAMAQWLNDQIPVVVLDYLSMQSAS